MLSLRDSGKLVGRSAGIRQIARGCNQKFPLSLRTFINMKECPFLSSIRLHLKVWTNPNISVETMLNRMREVYSTAGIGVIVATREDRTGTDIVTSLRDLDVIEDCPSGQLTAEQIELFDNNKSVGALDLVVHFVRTTNPAYNGCAAHPPNIFGAVVTKTASVWTLAHEVAHVLGLPHISGEDTNCPATKPNCCSTPDNTRLMTGCSTSNITGTPTINQSEMDTLRRSKLARRI